ncbi:MAG: class I SAM-dependent methyltransferase [Candidatus Methanoperedens sp.]|nr:class I SAM-dependent methyltransferase [Candidatus Methanoperedens sp.]
MIKQYHEYTNYTRYVDFKRLDFIIQSIIENSDKNTLEGLDLGCGMGNITIPLAILGYRMTGIDISPKNINNAKSRKITVDNPFFLVEDAENFSLGKDNLDFVICSEVLEHLNSPHRALNLINKVLRNNGLLIVTVPNGYGPYSLIADHLRNKVISRISNIKPSEHVKTFSLSNICNLIEEAGFDILKINHSDFISFLPVLVKSKRFCHLDCYLADKLPSAFVSGYFMICRKKSE